MRFVMVFLLLGAMLGSATAEVLVVAPDGSGDYPTIQAAVDASSEGDEIVLENGVYRGEGNRDILIIEHPVVVRSASGDPSSCVIDCQGSAEEWHFGFWFDGGLEWPTIEGISIVRGYAYYGGAVRIGYGHFMIRRCVFVGNQATDYGAAVSMGGPGVVTLDGCTLVGNGSPGGTVNVFDWASLVMERTIVAYSEDGKAVTCVAGQADVSCCNFFGNADGDWNDSCVYSQFGVDGNISEDPLFCGWEEGNYYLQSDSPCAPGGECGLIGALPVGCEPSPIMESTWGEIKALYRR